MYIKKSPKILPMTRNQSCLAAALFLSCFVFWFFMEIISDEFLIWIGGKENLSGWVQAVGVIVALFLTLRHADLPKKQAIESSVSQAKGLAITLYKYLHCIRVVCPGKHADSFRFYASIILDLKTANANLNFGSLPSNILIHLYEIRTVCSMIEEFSKALEKNNDPSILENLYSMLEHLSSTIDYSLKTIILESNSILSEKTDFEELVKNIEKNVLYVIKQSESFAAATKAASDEAVKNSSSNP